MTKKIPFTIFLEQFTLNQHSLFLLVVVMISVLSLLLQLPEEPGLLSGSMPPVDGLRRLILQSGKALERFLSTHSILLMRLPRLIGIILIPGNGILSVPNC